MSGILFLIIVVPSLIFVVVRSIKQFSRFSGKLSKTAPNNPAWDKKRMAAFGQEIFTRYRQDWASYNLASLKTYTTPAYFERVNLLLIAMQQAHRQEQFTIIKAPEVSVPGFHPDNTVVVNFYLGRERHQVIDTRTNNVLFTDSPTLGYMYHFEQAGDSWLFAGYSELAQMDAQLRTINLAGATGLEDFAKQNGMYYSSAIGNSLLPNEGNFFHSTKFGVSTVTDHVIGMVGQALVQLYVYQATTTSAIHFIAQTYLPKSYGRIAVRRKGLLDNLSGPANTIGLHEVSTESLDFNAKYTVFTDSNDGATSLELLNPKFMEQLQAVPFEVNLEVVDNALYLYAPQDVASQPSAYQIMLDLLQAAFMEMRM